MKTQKKYILTNCYKQDIHIGDIVTIASGSNIVIVKISHEAPTCYVANLHMKNYPKYGADMSIHTSKSLITFGKLECSYKVTDINIINKFKEYEESSRNKR